MLVQGRGDTRLFTLGRRACEEVSGQRMWDAGVPISGASDNPVTPFVVTDEIEIGVTRNSPFPGEEDTDMTRWPEQGLTACQMLEAYTKHSAHQNFWDDLVGTVEAGKRADIVVLDRNILEVDPVEINESRVLYTVSDGRVVYRGPGAPSPLRSRGARKEGTAPSLGPFLFACGRVCDCLGPIRW